MKITIWACIILILLFLAVIINSFALRRNIDLVYQQVENAPTEGDIYQIYAKIYEDYMKKQTFLSLSVNHQDTSEIENCFAEILGAAKASDTESLIIAKSRLMRSLSHLRRLSGINFDSII